jgi:hypothetical protein
MPNDVKIILEAVNNTKQAFNELEGQLNKTFGGATDSAGKAEKAVGGFSNSWAGLTAKIAVATGVIAGVIGTIRSFVNEAAEAEEIENRLRFAVETNGYSWRSAKGAVDEFATSVQNSTRFSDEQARQALTNMMMYTRDFAKAQMGAKLAMDMSIRTGQDLGSTTRYVGMAMNGSVEVLARFIPELRNLDEVLGKDATAAEKAEYALKILQQKFGGTAQADVKTYKGALEQLKNQWSDFGETLGNIVLPTLTKVLGVMTSIFKAVNEQMNKGPLKQIEEEIDVIDQAIEKVKKEAEKGFIIEPHTGVTIFKVDEEIQERILHLEQLRQNLLEKRGQILAQQRLDQERLAEETKKDVLPGGAKGAGKELLDLEQKALEENAKAWGEYAQQQLDALEKMITGQNKERESVQAFAEESKKAILDLSLAYADLTGNFQEQLKISKELEDAEVERLEKQKLLQDANVDAIERRIEALRKLGEETRKQKTQQAQAEWFKYPAYEAPPTPEWEEKGFAEIERRTSMLNQFRAEYASLIGDTETLIALDREEEKTYIEGLRRKGELTDELEAKIRQAGDERRRQMTDEYQAWIGFTQNISSAFSSGFFDLFKSGLKDAGDAFKQFVDNMLQSFLRAISQMIANWALFGNIKGTYEAGSGLLGIIGGALGMKEGGAFWTTGATPLVVGEGGESELVTVTPMSKFKEGSGAGNVTVNVINNSSRTETRTRESDDGRGNRRVDVIISDIISRETRRYGSPMNQSIQSMGGRNQLIRR